MGIAASKIDSETKVIHIWYIFSHFKKIANPTYFVFQNSSRVSEKRNPVAMIIINAWDKRPSRDWCNWLELTNWVSDNVGCDAILAAAGMARWLPWKNTSMSIVKNNQNLFL